MQIMDMRSVEAVYQDNVNVAYEGSVTTEYVFGDIRFPADPVLSDLKQKFDIITDSEDWTENGPISGQYVGLADNPISSTNMFSWEGRSNPAPKKLTRALASLDNYNQE